jgi:pilus assembly protein FimV
MAALLTVLVPCVAGAAGMGRLNVLSALGQPLVAEIDLLSVTREELGSLSARLASPDAYRQANLQYNPALTGARVSIERRANGQHFIRVVTTRPVSEPFIDLLIELTWAQGRLSREYTALLDPPGVAPATPAPVIAAVPEARPVPAPPPAAAPAPAPASKPVARAAPKAGAKEYGPIERGETLGKIARDVMPEGVTLEQMLVALYRNNPDAFIRKNLNLVRAGRILRVPDREEVAAVAPGEAIKEYRAHVADWNSYRQQLAAAAGTVPAEGRTAVGGRITAQVQDKGAGDAPKDVVRVSKGESPAAKGKPASAAERVRALEEEAVAREKALAEANDRIAQLEKTIQEMKKLIELKSPGLATAQQQAQQAAAPKVEPKPAVKPEEKKPEAAAAAKPEPAKPAEAPKPVAAPEAKPEQVAAAAAKKEEPAAKPKPKPVPAPKKEPELLDQVLDAVTDPLYLGAGGGVIVLGGLAFWMMRRRRQQAAGAGEEPMLAPGPGGAAEAAGAAAVAAAAAVEAAPAEDVDPLAEAEVYIAYGRDGQAEEILKEALARNPQRQDVQLKLLEIYSGRRDKTAFAKVAGELNKQTGGSGDVWLKAAAMGYALDAANPLYAAGKDVAVAAPDAGAAAEIDLDLGLGDTGTATDITLEAGATEAAGATDAAILDVGAPEPSAQEPAAVPDFNLELPPAGDAQPQAAAAPAEDSNVIDFQIELPKAAEDAPTQASAPAASVPAGDGGLDFKLDELSLNLDEAPKPAAAGGGEKDGHWYDVQTKFDLAKAYQEMGDKDGAREILQEVVKEGDAEQQAQAKALLDSLG